MKFTLNEKIKDIKGKDLDVTYGQALADILLAADPGDAHASKYRYFTLAMKAGESKDVDWDKETVEFILGKVERVSTPLYVGRIKEKLSILDEKTA